MRSYRNPAVEKDKERRRAAVAKRYKLQERVAPFRCCVCGEDGPLNVVKLSSSIVHFCSVDFQDFSDRVASLVKDMKDAGIQHSDQGEFPERLAEGLRQSAEQPVPSSVQVHEADGARSTAANTGSQPFRSRGSTAG